MTAGKRWSDAWRYVDALVASDLSPTALRVGLALARHADASGLAWPHLTTIVEKTRRKRSSVLAALPELEAAGFVVVAKATASEKARGHGNSYTLTMPGEQVQKLGPAQEVEQVRELGPSRSENLDGAGPETWTQPADIPLSVKEPLEGTNDRTTRTAAEGWCLSTCEQIARESAKAHQRPFGGKAAQRAAQAVFEFVSENCEGYEARAAWALVASWACAKPWGTELPGIGALVNDPARFHEMREHRSEPTPPPDHVAEIDQPGWTQGQREDRERRERERLAAEEAHYQKLSKRWAPLTEAEHLEALETQAEIDALKARLRATPTTYQTPSPAWIQPPPHFELPADWVIKANEGRILCNAYENQARASGMETQLDQRGRDAVTEAALALVKAHGPAEWRPAAEALLGELFDGATEAPDPARLLKSARKSATEAA